MLLPSGLRFNPQRKPLKRELPDLDHLSVVTNMSDFIPIQSIKAYVAYIYENEKNETLSKYYTCIVAHSGFIFL